jgi:YjbE family integral membrane protein
VFELGLAHFMSALAAIVVIDIVLAGDNAIVIALAARSLPAHLQKSAIVWGAVGAIGVRSALTVAVVWLLKIPGLLLAGGLLLLWIAYRLLVPEHNGDGGPEMKSATTFWAAMRTIVVADAIMGLDNVLAVAGAAHGSYLLVILGLAISVPIVIWGSTLVLRLVERYPAVVYVGAAVLLVTSVKMMRGEPLLVNWFDSEEDVGLLLYLLVPVVLAAGLRTNHRRRAARIQARLAELAPRLPVRARAVAVDFAAAAIPSRGEFAATRADAAVAASAAVGTHTTAPETSNATAQTTQPVTTTPSGAALTAPPLEAAVTEAPVIAEPRRARLRVLLPVDGSRNALRAVRHVIDAYHRDHELEVYLLNVQRPFSHHVARFLARGSAATFHRDQAEHALRGARRLLRAHQVPFEALVAVGDRAQVICDRARALACHHIVLGTARRSSLTRMLEDSVTSRVLEQTPVPVEIVTGSEVSPLERYGVPIGIGAGLGLLLLAID